MLVAALLGPLLIYLNEGNYYSRNIISHLHQEGGALLPSSFFKNLFFSFSEKTAHAYTLIKEGFGSISLLLAFLGLIPLIFKKRKELLIVFSLLMPVLILIFYGGGNVRYFLSSYFALSILASVFLFYLTAGICGSLNLQKYRNHAFFLFLFVLLCFNFINFHNFLMAEKAYSEELDSYLIDLTNNFPAENTVFLVGGIKSHLLRFYYLPLSQSKNEAIVSGWPWPGQRLKGIIINYLSQNKTIVVDANLSHFDEGERGDMEQMLKSYNLENASMGLFILKGPKS
jgi:hypothetical protein